MPLLEKVRITDIGSEGNALARVDNQVVFVPMLIPGDVVDIRVIRKRKKYLEGSVVRFHEYSPERIKPVCRHFGVCGGCKWQHLPYELQLKFKQKQVVDNLTRIGKVQLPVIDAITGSSNIFNYRNKLEYTFSDRRWLTREEVNSDSDFEKEDALGFHIPGLFDKVLDIRECHLQPEPSNAIREAVRRYAHKKCLPFFNLRQQSGFLRNLIIRNTSDGKVMVILIFFLDEKERREGLLDFIASEFPQISSLFYIINNKRNDSLSDQEPVLYRGDGYLVEYMDGLKFRIGPKSFYQTNTEQALSLYMTARDFAGLSGNEIVYDLYTGTGTIANYVASMSAKVIGIEYIEDAVKDACINSELNNIRNAKFFAGDMRKILSEQFISENGHPDVIITDPPRAGMHEDVVKTILAASPEKIVYISCNPSTQARDILLLSEKFDVARVQPVDMFPHTHHVENVVLLKKRSQ
ncbi:MAG: 23S rRNA (uracil(1939)-C(5))-methyltransferase RlmD [Bacteroidales bacterium]|jgi:23S rRNA (uracil1939-C5)-methyltransferase|nr:23S rRNA (uracil(1939)-C(5))-methyltransferase RlmD [Bacteroidales bacterium]